VQVRAEPGAAPLAKEKVAREKSQKMGCIFACLIPIRKVKGIVSDRHSYNRFNGDVPGALLANASRTN